MSKPHHELCDPSIRAVYYQAAAALAQAPGDQDGHRSAEWMLLALLQWSRSDLFMRWEEAFPTALEDRWREMIARRLSGEPVQYIVGEQEFMGLTFAVSPAVLIPRPETELLLEQVLYWGDALFGDGRPYLADIGCGSGALAVSAAVLRPRWQVAACDLSAQALAAARANAVRHGVASRLAFLQGDLLAPLLDVRESSGLPDMVITNPPYIPTADIAGLATEVRDHEPHLALDGGADGLQLYRRMLQQIDTWSAPPRVFAMELGQGQAQTVAEWVKASGHWTQVDIIDDLAGIQRHVVAVKN